MELSFQYIKELLNKGRPNTYPSEKYEMEYIEEGKMQYCIHYRGAMGFIEILRTPNGDYILYDSGLSTNRIIRRESDIPNYKELLNDLELDIQYLAYRGLKI